MLRIGRWIIPVAASVLLATSPARADGASPWRFTLGLGAHTTDVSGDRDAKFEEYRDLWDDVWLDEAKIDFVDVDSPWTLSLDGERLGLRDERAALRWAKAGLFRLDGRWTRTPHLLARGATSLWTGREVLELPDALQDTIERFFTATVPPTTAQARAFMAGILAANARSIDLRTQRDTARFDLGFELTPSWDLALGVGQERKFGTSRVGTGTYIRRQTVGSFDRNRFEPRTAELPKPIDSSTDELALGTTLHRRHWFVDLHWDRSEFTNDAGVLTWDNPFEGFPGATSSRTGNTPGSDQEPAGPTANTNNRGRFDRAQLDLAPSHDHERYGLTGGVNLPARMRLTGAYSRARTTQDDPFLPYTLSAAVIFANGPDGVGGTADDVLAKDLALPRSSLDGELRTERLDLRLTSRPIDPLSLRAHYRRYDYQNETAAIVFPGFASAGDSYFRPGIGQRDASGTRVLFTNPGGYERTRWALGGAWDVCSAVTLDLEYGSTETKYDERQVEATTEDSLGVKLRWALGERASLRLSYLDASRDFDGAYQVGFETSRLRAFDVWNRDRTRYGADFDLEIGDESQFSLSYVRAEDDYPGVVPIPTPAPAANPFPSLPYGLNATENETVTASFVTGREKWNLSLSAGLESSEWTSLATAKTSLTGDSPQFDPVNRWVRNQIDDVVWAALAFDRDLTEVIELRADLDYHDYEGDYRTTNLGTPNVNDGVAYAVPGFASSLFSGRLTVAWKARKNLDLEFQYWYEPYRLDDWQWDLVEPYMQGVLQEVGGTAGAVRDANAFRTLFLDATYSDYTAHVVSLWATFHF